MSKKIETQEQLLKDPILTLHIESLGKLYQEAAEKKDYIQCDKIKIELDKILNTGGIDYLSAITIKN